MIRRGAWMTGLGLLLTLAPSAGAAKVSNYLTVGTRTAAMGGAFVGVADDVNASVMNPAGLPRLQRQEYTFGYLPAQMVNDYETGMAAATLPLGDRQALGLDVFYDQLDDAVLKTADFRIGLSYGVALHRTLSLGVSARYFTRTVEDRGVNFDDGKAVGVDAGLLFDIGTLIPSLESLKLGFSAKNIGGTQMTHSDTDVSEELYPATYTLGLSYYVMENLLVAADLNDRIMFGAEVTLLNHFALRAGLKRDIFNYDTQMYYTAGIGVKWKGFVVDYAIETHPVLNMTQYVSLSFVYNPSFVRIKEAKLAFNPLYRSLYKYYELSTDRFVDVTLKNTSQEPLQVTVGLSVPTMTADGKFYEEQVTLQPQSTTTIPMGVTFSDSILLPESASYDRFVQPEVVVTYIQENETKRETLQLPSTFILGKNKMTWDDPRRVASFIYYDHVDVERFRDEILARHNDLLGAYPKVPNLARAMLFFDALGRMGISYNPDPSTPFFKISGDSAAAGSIADLVRYPTETFKSKGGDCDDLMVLYTSVLESGGIATSILDVFDPAWGHVYMMFDSGVSPEDAADVFVNTYDYVELDGKIWIPVETTMYGKPFMDAWAEGAREYHQKLNDPSGPYIRAFNVQDARNIYPPGLIEGFRATLPSAQSVDELMELDRKLYDRRIITAAAATIEGDVTAEKLYQQAVYFIKKDLLDAALTSLDQSLAMDPEFLDALNAKGIALSRKGSRVLFDDFGVELANTFYNESITMYRRAIDLDPSNAGFRLNLALVYRVMGQDREAESAYVEAHALDEALPLILDDLFR